MFQGQKLEIIQSEYNHRYLLGTLLRLLNLTALKTGPWNKLNKNVNILISIQISSYLGNYARYSLYST